MCYYPIWMCTCMLIALLSAIIAPCYNALFQTLSMVSWSIGIYIYSFHVISLQWRHNDYDSVSNHQLHGCLLKRLFRPRSKKTWKLRVTGLCVGNSPGPVNSPHKGPVTRKMFPFDDVIMKKKRNTLYVYVLFRAICIWHMCMTIMK